MHRKQNQNSSLLFQLQSSDFRHFVGSNKSNGSVDRVGKGGRKRLEQGPVNARTIISSGGNNSKVVLVDPAGKFLLMNAGSNKEGGWGGMGDEEGDSKARVQVGKENHEFRMWCENGSRFPAVANRAGKKSSWAY